MYPEWLPDATMSASFATIRILNAVCKAGKPAVDRRRREVITARLSYDDFQRLCRLARASVAEGIRAAVAEGWLFCRPGVAPDRRTSYSVPLALNSSKTELSSPDSSNGGQSYDGSKTELTELTSLTDSAFYTHRFLGPDSVVTGVAHAMDGLDEEIAHLRLMLRDVALNEPDRIDLYLRGVEVLSSLLGMRHRTKSGKLDRRERVLKAYYGLAVPLGEVAMRYYKKKFPDIFPDGEEPPPPSPPYYPKRPDS